MKKKPINYVDNEKLFQEMVLYKKQYRICKEQNLPSPRYNDYIGGCIIKIADNVAKLPKFSGYTAKEEMIGDGIRNVILYLHNFDEEKYNNPFAYISQIIYYAFIQRIIAEKKELYVKYKTTYNKGIYDDVVEGVVPLELYDNISEFIVNFEKRKKEKTDLKKEKLVFDSKVVKKKGIEEFFEG